MYRLSIIIALIVSCSAKPEDKFFESIKNKTYYTWAYNGDLTLTQKYTVHQEGKLIQFYDSTYKDRYYFEFRELISDTRAIYLQKSSAPDQYIAFVLSNSGNDIYYAFNPNSMFTNNIDWSCQLYYMKTK